MKVAIFALVVVALQLAQAIQQPLGYGDEAPILKSEMISHINNLEDNSWTAAANPRFKGMSVRDFKRLLGVKRTPGNPPQGNPILDVEVVADPPASFDSRQKWPMCTSIATIRDQGHCGSCWAFGCAEALSDRFCIQGKVNVTLAPQDLTSCDGGSSGCDGGMPAQAWSYAKSQGVVTESCMAYAMGTCHHPGCSDWPTPSCNKTCDNGSPKAASKHFAATAYGISSNVAKIQTEIMTNGPVEVSFDVYEDFATYSSGVYVHKTGSFLGGHAVKAIGWGVDSASNQPYWLIANSWNTSWGMDGYFMILRGKDECGIESDVQAGLAKV
eukprot:TRINITY_DN461_c0_g1_i1.p1 TRINITY_DN461_c0_g1~~TRINITY_DN461_c0_g1_i1.p1  ORF type:complete len:336 (+),score=92.09 TRINITY_DN461_c0_g1_i1:30-1010(+)